MAWIGRDLLWVQLPCNQIGQILIQPHAEHLTLGMEHQVPPL